ncbi:DNA polymerase III PolC-type-like [Brienomyrus brachyistius]|uniref:DNA polymerase III PolC-type-like n=1 Tax=Brienomyrus brachyistius TaxID=42636 RepID=UPI0020B29060|nr:DNA polymerase III PolC-type-like [Brienomyrus brachyistius]
MQSVWNPTAAWGRYTGAASSQYTFVFFDLETTGLDVSQCDIVQLSAVCGDRTFNKYVIPSHSITAGASRVTGFTVEGDRLLQHGQPVWTVPLGQALIEFLTFLRGFHRPVLVAHNALDFDAPILLRNLSSFSLCNELTRIIVGFLDTLRLSRDLPECSGLTKFSQEYLVKWFLGKSYMAHDALEDSKLLQELFRVWSPSQMLLDKHLYPIDQVRF